MDTRKTNGKEDPYTGEINSTLFQLFTMQKSTPELSISLYSQGRGGDNPASAGSS